jgi:hypothetical protein
VEDQRQETAKHGPWTLWGAENTVTSCDLQILVHQVTEAVSL